MASMSERDHERWHCDSSSHLLLARARRPAVFWAERLETPGLILSEVRTGLQQVIELSREVGESGDTELYLAIADTATNVIKGITRVFNGLTCGLGSFSTGWEP